ncbi:MAG TPA: IPT/TIG domain-containing protein [Bryobacteraceae bacterium]|nr:IPT/TIG domain-containing protein [Bryobacteraceae bacterium]
MRLSLVLSVVSFGLTLPLAAQVPQMSKVEPSNGTIGSVLRVHGVYLGKAKVDEVYLTDHTFDMKVKVLDQTDDAIEFRIPPSVKPGKLQLLVKTTGKQPLLLEQPVYITVEQKDSGEVAATH